MKITASVIIAAAFILGAGAAQAQTVIPKSCINLAWNEQIMSECIALGGMAGVRDAWGWHHWHHHHWHHAHWHHAHRHHGWHHKYHR